MSVFGSNGASAAPGLEFGPNGNLYVTTNTSKGAVEMGGPFHGTPGTVLNTISGGGTNGTARALVFIPEPATMGLMAVGAMMLLRRRR